MTTFMTTHPSTPPRRPFHRGTGASPVEREGESVCLPLFRTGPTVKRVSNPSVGHLTTKHARLRRTPASKSHVTLMVVLGARRSPRSRRAYVLPLTLLLLAVAAASLAGVCRVSFEKAVQAAGAREDLQRRWAVTSCRAALLPKAERVLASVAPSSSDQPSSEVRLQLALGGLPLELVFGDEQAKVNVDLLYRTGGRAGTERAVRELTAAGGADVRVALAPGAPLLPVLEGSVAALQQEQEDRFFESWSQVLGDTPPAALIARRGGEGGASTVAQLTCWGDGTLNYRRASVAALRHTCPKSLGATGAARLVGIRRKEPELEVWEALERLDLSDEELEEASERLTEDSSCYSLWIVARSGGRAWYDLSIADGPAGGDDGGATATFAW